jgi:phosphoribosylanthranilate isomerase
MKVKICGILDVKTACFAVEAGADAIGLVFAESKRKISYSKAKEIVSTLPKEIFKIGVFVNESKEMLEHIYEEVGLTHLQLHGDESPEFCRQIKYPTIKALHVKTAEDLEMVSTYDTDYILLDSPVGKYRGGNGVTFDWELLLNKKLNREKLILAGGLTIDNVSTAIQLVKPDFVDVSSGVETNGNKDLNKIAEFIKTVKLGGNG